jgi:hypothetical protein
MIRSLVLVRFLAGALATLLGTPAAVAQNDWHGVYEQAMQTAQRAADEALRATDAAMREVDEAIAGIDFDDLTAQTFLSRELGGPREIVKNAPYTAQAVTETIQTLGDGNRIVHRSVALLARDSAGRTRQEKKTTRGGTAYIYDPIESRSYVLRTDGKVAVPLPRASASAALPVPAAPPAPPAPSAPPAPPAPPAPRAASAPPAPPSAAVAVQPGRVVVRKGQPDGSEDIHVEVIRVGRDDETSDANARVGPVPPLPPMPPLTLRGHPFALPYGHGDRGVVESLGSRDFDGVRADGKRTTRTIPAGAVGNEKPIALVSERWFSPELNIVVMSRDADPRSGETVYRLTDIKRGEPPAELFKVPADYKVRGAGSTRGR